MTKYVVHHSRAWIELVEDGWITESVHNGIALMRELAMLRGYRLRQA